MKVINLLPADIYTVINKTVLNDKDRGNLITFYMPIIGSLPVTLYLTLWRDLNRAEIMSIDLTHHHLMSILKTDLDLIKKARESLEAVGLLKTYVKCGDVNKYVYELYSPLSASEFLNHPVLNVVLYNNIGKTEYDLLRREYQALKLNLNEYDDITKMMNMVFKSSTYIDKVDIKERKCLGVSVDDVIDFDTLISMMPKGIINDKTFNKRNKELINNLAFIYNIDTVKMGEIIRLVLEENGKINSVELRKSVQKYYQYNYGKLPTLVYRTQPDYLKSPVGDNSNKAKIVYVFENTTPYDFLKSKNKGSKPTDRDLKLIEDLIIEVGLKPGVVNVIVDYTLKKNNNKLNKTFMEAIAGQLKRNGVETALDALESIQKEQKKIIKKVSGTVKKISNKEPVWFNETIKKETPTEEESKELEDLFNMVDMR